VEDQPPKAPQITEKRQKILDKALTAMRKARGQMDPDVINKIRRMIASSPEIMKKLNVENDLKPKEKSLETSRQHIEEAALKRHSIQKVDRNETIDQKKNMEVMAKLLALNPQARDRIIETIKKAKD
jgi:plasmid maintenance system antidote protein VapI